jgi:DNA invertase Pin-like site-specific DNA recombinase
MPPYVIYARKSSESEDRQVLSIESQIAELRRIAESRDLHVANVITESRSAKAPGRPAFAKMLRAVSRKRVAGILCWKLDRLARNPVDGGAVIWAIEEGALSEIITPQNSFSNTGNDKFWMQLEFGMAKKYVDDLSENVKRGNRAKLEQGWLPGVPPIGYINDLATKTIIPDPERFDLVRKMWDLALAGEPLATIRRRANEQWHFRSRRFRRMGGLPLGHNSLYKLFANPFYYGLIARKGEVHRGAHEPMITKDQFERVQVLLGRPTRPTRNRRSFAFTGLIRCGGCGAAVTAEEKVNRYGTHYTYYHCTHRRRHARCRQPAIRAEALEDQILATLRRLHLDPFHVEWAQEHIDRLESEERRVGAQARESLASARAGIERQLAQLTDLRIRGLLNDEEFSRKRRELIEQQMRLDEQLRGLPENGDSDQFSQLMDFGRMASLRFQTGSIELKRAILSIIGSHPVLRDRKLEIRLEKPFEMVADPPPMSFGPDRRFPPPHRAMFIGRDPDAEAVIRSWQARCGAARTWFREHPHTINWPSFCKPRRRRRRSKRRHTRRPVRACTHSVGRRAWKSTVKGARNKKNKQTR